MIVWARVAEILRARGAAALVSVHAARGSAPREPGARMVVRPDGAFHGTIGGGRLEWEALAAAGEALGRGRGPARFHDRALGPDLGQCCGGHVRLLVETFGVEDLEAVEALAALEADGAFEVVCRLDGEGRVARTALPEVSSEGATTTPGGSWLEGLGERRTPLLLFGAGHVGRALVLALAPLPFRVRWIDTRPDAFPAAMPGNAVPVRAEAPEAEIAAAPAGAFVLVMTHDHPLDLAITAAALARPDLPFVGLIGSATKRARFERRFRELGLAPERIAALACPIGIAGVAGKEPAVIAAATAAQVLLERERARDPSRGRAAAATSHP
ncbi:MAG TPA: xanthine dehydrogenase accessory protein XdhC [Salinarimonas sp.]|nr:xanthine dehydrogenase accessory protein XdhC [Salinarimonas sp.]